MIGGALQKTPRLLFENVDFASCFDFLMLAGRNNQDHGLIVRIDGIESGDKNGRPTQPGGHPFEKHNWQTEQSTLSLSLSLPYLYSRLLCRQGSHNNTMVVAMSTDSFLPNCI